MRRAAVNAGSAVSLAARAIAFSHLSSHSPRRAIAHPQAAEPPVAVERAAERAFFYYNNIIITEAREGLLTPEGGDRSALTGSTRARFALRQRDRQPGQAELQKKALLSLALLPRA